MASSAAREAAPLTSAELGLGSERAAEEGLLMELPPPSHGMESSDEGRSTGPVHADVRGRQLLPLRHRRALAKASALGAAALLLACGALVGTWLQRPAGPETGRPGESTGLSTLGSMLTILGTMAESVHEAAELTDNVEKGYTAMGEVAGLFNESEESFGSIGSQLAHELGKPIKWREELREKFKSLNATQKEKVKEKLLRRFNITSLKELRPKTHMHDNNLCQDDEEEHAHLCYKKCSLLTDGHFPYRVSAWECCQHEGPCDGHYRMDLRLCGGFGVSGDSMGNGCPHTPGGCLKNEELFGNFCYQRCSMLTFNVLPHRAGPGTCCRANRAHDLLAFLDVEGCDAKDKYRVGGGGGDGDGATPDEPHLPMTVLTESSV